MRGEGRIYRKPGRKVWMLDYAAVVNGKPVRVRETAETEDEEVARHRLAKRVGKADQKKEEGSSFETPAIRRTRVDELLDALKDHWTEQEIKGLSRAEYRLRVLRERFGTQKASTVTTAALSAFVKARRAEGLANASINREMEILRTAFRLAVPDMMVKVPKFPKRLPEKNVRQGFFEREDVDALLPHLPPMLQDLVRLAFRCGWRRGELFGLTWDAVHKDEIRLATTKNGEPRSLPIDGEELKALFTRLKKARDYQTPDGTALSAFVFHHNGQPLNRNTFIKVWRRACIDAKLGHRDEKKRYHGKLFHDLRRSAVRAMIRGGVPESIAMTVSGHKTRSMLDRYDIADLKDKRLALELARKWTEAQGRGTSTVVVGMPR